MARDVPAGLSSKVRLHTWHNGLLPCCAQRRWFRPLRFCPWPRPGWQRSIPTGPQFQKLELVYEKIKENYVEPVDDDTLIKGAIDGMLATLDPHSAYLEARDFENLRTQTEGAYGGLGLSVTLDDGAVKVIAPMKGTPAISAGSRPATISPTSTAS
jgi:C-terminal processing protease CtpA/Prc